MCLAQHFEKLSKQEGICDFDGDVWVRFVATADDTVVFAEPLPHPGVYGGINENDNRYANPSMAHDLLVPGPAYQHLVAAPPGHEDFDGAALAGQ